MQPAFLSQLCEAVIFGFFSSKRRPNTWPCAWHSANQCTWFWYVLIYTHLFRCITNYSVHISLPIYSCHFSRLYCNIYIYRRLCYVRVWQSHKFFLEEPAQLAQHWQPKTTTWSRVALTLLASFVTSIMLPLSSSMASTMSSVISEQVISSRVDTPTAALKQAV